MSSIDYTSTGQSNGKSRLPDEKWNPLSIIDSIMESSVERVETEEQASVETNAEPDAQVKTKSERQPEHEKDA